MSYTYEIEKNAPPVPPHITGNKRTAERIAMEALEVGDAFYVKEKWQATRARYARYALRPRKFTVHLCVDGERWQVRRIL